MSVTKTVNPIHFEDLEPHRFEDLSRQLIYDFRDWQTIEGTGRSGNDGGFDIRAFEKNIVRVDNVDEDELAEEDFHPMKGNEWMIQCKREKTITPGKIKNILKDIQESSPPYGYILMASANFSKESHDLFRQILLGKGVMEFFLWGRDVLEDMLYMPKNDRILFSFFGISLTSKRKARSSEIRSSVLTKNKLFALLGREDSDDKQLLIRDINDEHYPKHELIPEFQKYPPWQEYSKIKYGGSGIWVLMNEFFAFFDHTTKEWDYSEVHDLIYRAPVNRKNNDRTYFDFYHERRKKSESVWDCLPRSKKIKYIRWGLVKFEDILLIDGKGDKFYDCPHIFVDFKPGTDPFTRYTNLLLTKQGAIEISQEKHPRINKFPKTFSSKIIGEIYKDRFVHLDAESFKDFKNNHERFNVILDTGDKYDFLEPKDIIGISDGKNSNEPDYIFITHKTNTTIKKYLEENHEDYYLENFLKQQGSGNLAEEQAITLLEFKKIYKYEFENDGKG